MNIIRPAVPSSPHNHHAPPAMRWADASHVTDNPAPISKHPNPPCLSQLVFNRCVRCSMSCKPEARSICWPGTKKRAAPRPPFLFRNERSSSLDLHVEARFHAHVGVAGCFHFEVKLA